MFLSFWDFQSRINTLFFQSTQNDEFDVFKSLMFQRLGFELQYYVGRESKYYSHTFRIQTLMFLWLQIDFHGRQHPIKIIYKSVYLIVDFYLVLLGCVLPWKLLYIMTIDQLDVMELSSGSDWPFPFRKGRAKSEECRMWKLLRTWL